VGAEGCKSMIGMTGSGTGRSERIRLAYILAASHSGSTLLAMLLGSHPDVCTVGELAFRPKGDMEKYRCSCRRPIKECPFWEGTRQDMAGKGFPFELAEPGTDFRWRSSRFVARLLRPLCRGPVLESLRTAALLMSPGWRALYPRIQAANAALAESLLARTGKSVLVDSSKVGLRLSFLLRNRALDVKVIRLIRDGRGVSTTYMDPARYADASDPALRDGGMGGDRGSERLRMEMAALEWRRSNEEAETILGRLDRSRWTEVRYEALCGDPSGTLRRLFGFLGVDLRRMPEDFRSVEHHVVGNGMRLDETSKIVLDERWRSVLDEKDLAVFDSVAGGLNRRLGYL
jgi:hypothetical protein